MPDAQRQSPNAAIAAHNVTLTLGSDKAPVEILRGVDLEVEAGTSVALLGPSGSGKSSLMAVLAGLERANGGSIHVAGLDFAAMDEDDLARARRGRIGIVLQAFHLLPTMTALENVAVPLELAGIADPFGRAARKLRGIVGEPVAEPDGFELGGGAAEGIGDPGEFERHRDIFQSRHRRQQVEGLEHDADPSAPCAREVILVHRREIEPRHMDAAAVGALEPREHRHQRAFARSRRAEQRDRRARRDFEIDSAQNFDRGLVAPQSQRHIMGGDRQTRRLSLGVGQGEDPLK